MSNDIEVQQLRAQLDQEKHKSENNLKQAMKIRDQWIESQTKLRETQSTIDALNASAARHGTMSAVDIQIEISTAKKDAATEIAAVKAATEAEVRKLNEELEHARVTLIPQQSALSAELRSLSAQVSAAKAELAEVKKNVIDESDMSGLNELGLYSFQHPAMDSVALEGKLAQVRNAMKIQLKNKSVISVNRDIRLEGRTEKESARFVEDMVKLMTRAYNSDAENCIKNVKGGNVAAAMKRLDQSKDQTMKLGSMIDLRVNNEYHTLRKQEIQIAAMHLEAKAVERDEERERKAEMKEQKRDKLLKEKQHYDNAIAKLEEEARRAEEAEAAAAKVIAEAQARADSLLAEAAAQEALESLDKLRAEAVDVAAKVEDVENQAANQRAGYVYVISNIGSFGERVVKIGMTRRLDPLERVKELGGASVPFGFDVHTIFFSDDAVNLENQLHKTFQDRRVNLINNRREFFYVTPREVRQALTTVSGSSAVLEFNESPDAEQYRASETMRVGGVRNC